MDILAFLTLHTQMSCVRYDKIAFVPFPVGAAGFFRFLRFQTVTGISAAFRLFKQLPASAVHQRFQHLWVQFPNLLLVGDGQNQSAYCRGGK